MNKQFEEAFLKRALKDNELLALIKYPFNQLKIPFNKIPRNSFADVTLSNPIAMYHDLLTTLSSYQNVFTALFDELDFLDTNNDYARYAGKLIRQLKGVIVWFIIIDKFLDLHSDIITSVDI